ncbi:hypothetical protein FCM35_KLT15504 [Carex littledalei]|uniref:Uncharacterized protein n=1 Tax=Carex littledalei TaxID=544730 RepID=A0A833VXH6_9POAL|nr:hypothetical protein FCM35_KLT15504 [Carex littledalei]
MSSFGSRMLPCTRERLFSSLVSFFVRSILEIENKRREKEPGIGSAWCGGSAEHDLDQRGSCLLLKGLRSEVEKRRAATWFWDEDQRGVESTHEKLRLRRRGTPMGISRLRYKRASCCSEGCSSRQPPLDDVVR